MGPREFHAEITSTQDRAVELARGGAPEGSRVVALRQSRGHGRLDHAWSSPAGGLYISIVLRAPVEHVTLLPLALGARLAHEFTDQVLRPLLGQMAERPAPVVPPAPARKVAGILVDRVDGPDHVAVEVAGIGVNVTTDLSELPPEVRERATSLAEVVRPAPTLDTVEAIVVRSAMRAAIGLQGLGGVEATQRLCRRWLFGAGHAASVDGRATGTIVGLGDDGELILEQGSERVAIRAGDVRVEGVA